ncbi:MAG: lysozyme [Erythrobacter sp.]
MFEDTPPTPPATPDRKPIFDLLRRLIGRGFRQSEVDRIDDVLDKALDEAHGTGLETRADGAPEFSAQDRVTCGPSVPHIRRTEALRPELENKARRIGPEGIALIKQFEGCARLRRDGLVEGYPDPGTGAEPWTIGWGATGLDDQTASSHGARIGPDTVWTQAQCDARLESDLRRYAREVERALGNAPTTQAQFDALVSFHYNTGAIARATLTRKHIAGDYAGALAEFARWNRAGGRVLKGLTRRRAAEARLYSDSARVSV